MTRWLLALTLLSGVAHGFETIDNNLYFPAVAQGHRGNTSASCNGLGYPALTQNNQAKITGTGGVALNFCASNQGSGMPLDACDNANGSRRLCTITGNPIRGLATSGDNSFLSSSGSDGDIGHCNSGQQLTLGSASQYQFGTISLYSACTLTFSSTRQEYRIQSLALGGAKVVLPAGDYWIDRLVVNQGGEIETRGNVRIFVNAVEFNGGRLNAAKTGSVLLFGYQNVNLNGESLVNGLVYADQALNMNNASVINGRTTSRSLFMSGTTAINDKMSPPVTAAIDHFEFDHSGNALTCNPETLTIRACANASCSQLFTDPVSAALIPAKSGSNGWIASGQVSYNGSSAMVSFSGGSTSLQLRNNLSGAVTVGVSGSTPSTNPLNTTLCRAGSGALSAAACTLSFADSGFVFDVLDTLANKPQQVVMTAVKKDDVSQQCVPGFKQQSKRISFWSDYKEPATNLFGSQIRIDNTAIATAAGTPSTMVLYFNEQGETTLKDVRYLDAGRVQLNARHDGSGDTAGLVMTGADAFVSRPVGLCIKAPQGECIRSANAGNADYAANCPVFKKTGETFSLNIQGVAWQADNDTDLCSGNLATPNFALTNIVLGSKLVAPKPGEEAVVGTPRYDHSNAIGSNNLNIVSQSVNEVGVFQMTATPPASGYFGYTIPAATSVPLGRFVPSEYSLSGGFITPACTPFSYMGQPFASGFAITARNAQQGTTLNYKGEFAKGSVSLVAENGNDGVDRSARIGMAPGLSWVGGVASVNQQAIPLANTRFDRGASAEDPLPSLDFGVKMADNDGGYTLLAGVDMKADGAGTCGSNCNAVKIGSQQLRYGRLLASTRQGVASAPLALPLQAQYFEGGLWRVNQQDVCTQISLANNGFDPTTRLDPTRKISFNNGSYEVTGQVPGTMPPQSFSSTLTLSGLAAPASVATANKGEFLLHFSAPVPNLAVRIPYQVVLENQLLQPSAPLWLSDPNSLLGEAIFGRDRGNDRIIYRREVMP
ncbi:hypothetical protein E4188_06000 [Aeromonas media]|uniref:DUF6701 domain-containing protein n=1 Tax=Aeromonas media TaxID=651 RepID=A0AAE7AEP1_AERME|nr:DUF6701 domain-containing protein [Aeromonas media]QJT29061.1 hypothetical protein E4186_01590 [Aeromonas media]QJT36323.1 hypothetical protein E4187_19830 [Aeromonas media]QJT38150.1 hypothetical protein E4188_06000 [Aeromonas media]